MVRVWATQAESWIERSQLWRLYGFAGCNKVVRLERWRGYILGLVMRCAAAYVLPVSCSWLQPSCWILVKKARHVAGNRRKRLVIGMEAAEADFSPLNSSA